MPHHPHPAPLSPRIRALLVATVEALEAWLPPFLDRLAAADAARAAPDLKELVSLLASLKRVLEIERLAELLARSDSGDDRAPIDPEALSRLLSEED